MALEKIFIVGVAEIIKKILLILDEHIRSVAWGFRDDLEKIKLSLVTIQAAVSDAELNQGNDQAAILRLKRLKDVYDADDVMDRYSYEYMRRDEEGSELKHKVPDLVSFRFKIAGKIRVINKALDEIHKEYERYHYRPNTTFGINVHQATEISNLQASSKWYDDSVLVGREDAKSEIVSMLWNQKSSPLVPSSPGHSSKKVNRFPFAKRLRILYPLGLWDTKFSFSRSKFKHLRFLDLSNCAFDLSHDLSLYHSHNLQKLSFWVSWWNWSFEKVEASRRLKI